MPDQNNTGRILARVRESAITYYRTYGLRGFAALAAHSVIRRPEYLRATHTRLRHPVTLRMRTTDVAIYAQLILDEMYAFELPFTPRVIADLGANVGMSAIYFANRYPEAKIIAVEAEASNFAVLTKNVARYPNITPIHAAIWNRNGSVVIDHDPGARKHWAFRTRDGEGVQVRSVTMTTLMRDLNIPVIDLMKIDIEGAEIELFEDTQWLNGVRCVMLELHDRMRPGCSAAVQDALRDFDSSQRGDMSFYLRKTS